MSDIAKKDVTPGGSFIVSESFPNEVFTPEDLTEEQLMVRQMVEDFLASEVEPVRHEIEKQQEGLVPSLLEKAGAMGLLGAHIPEEYGGLPMDTNTNTVISDAFGAAGSFIVSIAAHTGIGMLPILYFGTEAQKKKYLPGLSQGQLKACYCLTEPSSGSDALAAKTTAMLSEDGSKYVINGQKMWISNAGFADIFIVFAQIGGDKFTGFIVEKGTPGLTLGAEEDKMGIKGSSTRQVFFENMEVPADSVLGTIGKGHLIAFNALNVGRFKLGAMSIGGCKTTINQSIAYANERQQFKTSIGNFGAIQYKLAEMAIRTYAGESVSYRISQLMQEKKEEGMAKGLSFGQATLEAAEEYAIECSILKIIGSEVLDYVVDENVQIHGGIGFSEEYSAARAYRDSRINRIYEGTNEINRLLIVDMLLKRAFKGKLDLVGPAWAVQKELTKMPSLERPEGDFAEERKAVAEFKKIALLVAGAAAKMQMDGQLNLKNEQMVMTNISDILIDLYAAESTLLRIQKLALRNDTNQSMEVYKAILETLMFDSTSRINKNATDALVSFADGDMLRTLLLGVKRFTKYPPTNVRNNRKTIAKAMLNKNNWCF